MSFARATALTATVVTVRSAPGICLPASEIGNPAIVAPVVVPSVPTPFAGAVYILDRARVHPIDVPFTQAIQSVSRWGSGSKELVAAMKVSDALVNARVV